MVAGRAWASGRRWCAEAGPNNIPNASVLQASPSVTSSPTKRTVQVLVQRVQVAAGILCCVPVEHKLHALCGFQDFLLLFLAACITKRAGG